MFQINKSKESVGILLANTGTPDNPNPSAIKRYLREFLNIFLLKLKKLSIIFVDITLTLDALFILNITTNKKVREIINVNIN